MWDDVWRGLKEGSVRIKKGSVGIKKAAVTEFIVSIYEQIVSEANLFGPFHQYRIDTAF